LNVPTQNRLTILSTPSLPTLKMPNEEMDIQDSPDILDPITIKKEE